MDHTASGGAATTMLACGEVSGVRDLCYIQQDDARGVRMRRTAPNKGSRRTDMHRELKPVTEMETGTLDLDVAPNPKPRICCMTPVARATGRAARGGTAWRSGAR